MHRRTEAVTRDLARRVRPRRGRNGGRSSCRCSQHRHRRTRNRQIPRRSSGCTQGRVHWLYTGRPTHRSNLRTTSASGIARTRRQVRRSHSRRCGPRRDDGRFGDGIVDQHWTNLLRLDKNSRARRTLRGSARCRHRNGRVAAGGRPVGSHHLYRPSRERRAARTCRVLHRRRHCGRRTDHDRRITTAHTRARMVPGANRFR